MNKLEKLILELRENYKKYRNESFNEEMTKTVFINPILTAIGWNVRNPEIVKQEYKIVSGKSVDFALMIQQESALFIEAKALNNPLTSEKDIVQADGYASAAGIIFFVLTNGVKWKIYDNTKRCKAPDKLIAEIDLMGETKYVIKKMKELSYNSLKNKGLSKSIAPKQTQKKPKKKTIEDTIQDKPKWIQVFYKELRNFSFSLDPKVKARFKKSSVSFTVHKTQFLSIYASKSYVRISVRMPENIEDNPFIKAENTTMGYRKGPDEISGYFQQFHIYKPGANYVEETLSIALYYIEQSFVQANTP